MERKRSIDLTGMVMLSAFAMHLGFNQVVVKVTNGGFAPVFQAGLRSAGAVIVMLLWMWLRRIPISLPRVSLLGGFVSGVLFAVEFICLFVALDFTTVSRVSIFFYTMPVWLALAAHFWLPAEQLTRSRILGLVLAVSGVVLAMLNRDAGTGTLTGDLMALFGAICWAGIALCVRVTGLSQIAPAQQMLWQLVISAPMLLLAALFFGDLIRDVQPIHLAGLAFQIVAVASLGFMFWFWLMSIYPASSVASFSFLTPIFSVLFGWLLLSEPVSATIWAALALVAVGVFLINRR